MPDPLPPSSTEPVPPQAQGTASGKVILLGEHAVVYGAPALAVSLDRGAHARAHPAERDQIFIGGRLCALTDPLYDALSAVRQTLGAPPVQLELDLDLPAGSGLGASAALGAASARALASLLGRERAGEEIARAADAWEGVFHGNASGVDRAAALGHGAIRFVRGQPPVAVALRQPVHLVVAVAGPPASTKEMVSGVSRLRQTNRSQFDKNLTAIEALVDNALVCLRSGDHASLGKLLDLCQMVLSGWMLSTERIELACRTARDAGALGAKLTGAGGGGCIVALSPSDAMSAAIEAALVDQGFPAFRTRVEESPAHTCQHHDHG